MNVITVPHPTLRAIAQPITVADKKVLLFLDELQHTLRTRRNPRGVGLAAPQVDVSKRVFATFLPDLDEPEDAPAKMRIFINPEIIDHSDEISLGSDPENPVLEGCLSIPSLYGPVPRWEEINLKYFEIVNGELVEKVAYFNDFHARVVQHEFDHLDGVLFTDYSLKYDLPVYRDNPKTEKLEEIDKELLEIF